MQESRVRITWTLGGELEFGNIMPTKVREKLLSDPCCLQVRRTAYHWEEKKHIGEVTCTTATTYIRTPYKAGVLLTPYHHILHMKSSGPRKRMSNFSVIV